MNFLKMLIYSFARWILMATSVLSLLGGLLILSSLLFGLKPYIVTDNNTIWGYAEWERGIPVKASPYGGNLPDSSFYLLHTDWETNGQYYHSYKNDVMARIASLSNPVVTDSANVYADTILHHYTSHDPGAAKVNSVDINEVKAYVQPRNGKEKLVFMLPYILYLFFFAWSAWQLSSLLNDIIKGDAFRKRNHLRLTRIGYAVLLMEAIFLVLDLIKPSSSFSLQSVSSIENYRSPLKLQFNLDSNFNLLWLALGCFLIVISMAWKDGMSMQAEQDLTV